MAQLIHDPMHQTAVRESMDEIIANLWLGDILSTYNLEQVQAKNVTHVISLIDRPLPQWLRTRYEELEIKHTVFMIEDDELEDILVIMGEACNIIDATLQSGGGVLVHCGLGVSRSGSIVVGYFMREQKINPEKALAFVRTKRPRVQPNAGFWKQIAIWEECGFEVWDEDGSDKLEKPCYAEWKEEARKGMEERVRIWETPKNDQNKLSIQ